ncbi:transglycosylase family protein [Streptomyces collinus]|uniref:transglycosylase family protein n=1 Tax=Streptomyces collinus TaxID=42684 RepID=UPI0036BFB341
MLFFNPMRSSRIVRPSRCATGRARRVRAGVTVVAALLTMAVAVPAAQATDSSWAGNGANWDRVAACESTGDWRANTGNGFSGGLQFTASTWKEFGGHVFASSAHLATPEQQKAVANKILAVQGPTAWPVCSKAAGLS